jgi:glycosyltransferase involved in cell wall biosynthesis
MIPTYEPGPFLVEVLRGILAQDRGPADMQIAIVDDASPTVDVAALVAAAAPAGRIEIHRNPTNLGLAGNWNRGIELARGELVHLLHQDDRILPGFYEQLLRGFAAGTQVGMAFCRHAFVDGTGLWTRRSHRERWRRGLLSRWLDRISQRQRIQCPAAIVRRSVYEQLGGFRSDLTYALDWEMWVRIAASHAVWYEPRILACYRRHRGSETTRLTMSGKVGADVLNAIGIFSNHLPASRRSALARRAYQRVFGMQVRDSRKQLSSGSISGARQQLAIARLAWHQLPEGLGKVLGGFRLRRIERLCAAGRD